MPTTTDPSDNSGERHQRSRLETEIEEILERAEREHPLPPPTPIHRPKQRPRLQDDFRTSTLGKTGASIRQWLTAVPLIVAYMLAIVARLLSDVSPFLTRAVICLAVIAIFWPILESVREKQASTTTTTMWRGREIRVPLQQEPTRWEQFRQWLRNRKLLP